MTDLQKWAYLLRELERRKRILAALISAGLPVSALNAAKHDIAILEDLVSDYALKVDAAADPTVT
jgi:hypothetical protein